MHNALKFLKTTVIGGLLFLLPLALVMMLLGKIWPIARAVVDPAVEVMPRHVVAGIAVGAMGAVVLLVLVAFIAGLIARTTTGQSLVSWFEDSMVGSLPQYRVVRSIADNVASVDNSLDLKPALVQIEGGWRYGFVVEAAASGWVTVFLPDAPHPMSGSVQLLPASRVREIDVPVKDVIRLLRQLGAGSGAALARVSLA